MDKTCWGWAPKSMTWCNKLRFIYKFIYLYLLVSFYPYALIGYVSICAHIFYIVHNLGALIRSYIKYTSHEFFVSW